MLALAAFVIAAGEFYSVLMHRRYRPLSIFGFLGIVGAGLGTVVWGVIAIPIAFALMVTVILLFDAVSQRRQDAVSGFALTILVAVWIGGLGAFAFPIVAADNYQALLDDVGIIGADPAQSSLLVRGDHAGNMFCQGLGVPYNQCEQNEYAVISDWIRLENEP